MKSLTFSKGETEVIFSEKGDLQELNSYDIMINQLEGNPLDGSLNQLYLRLFTPEGIVYQPMIGSKSQSRFYVAKNQLRWRGSFEEIQYQVIFMLAEQNTWFWKVVLSGEGEVDIVYGQDIGNATKGAIQSNEAYTSQYVDHHVTNQNNLVVTSRQNQPQNGKFPVIEQGSLQPLISFSTDGYQFFGKSYTLTNEPEVLTKETLANEVYQYEFAYIALQTEKVQLSNEVKEIVFYATTKENQETAVTKPVFKEEVIKKLYETVSSDIEEGEEYTVSNKNIGKPVTGLPLTEQELATLYPEQLEIEKVEHETYSFFTPDYRHVVLQKKELEMERSHGHILLSGTDLTVDNPLMSTTVYMHGIFNSQVVLGNTNMNKLMSNSRNALNVMKKSGQRIYVKIKDTWRLLTMPSLFEMGLNSASWYYKLEEDVIQVHTYTVVDTREVRIEVTSENHQYDWIITNDFTFGGEEKATYELIKQENLLKLVGQQSITNQYYPNLTYYVKVDRDFQVENGEMLAEGMTDLVILAMNDQKEFHLSIQGSLEGAAFKETTSDLLQEEAQYLAFVEALLNHFELQHPTQQLTRMNLLSRWYTHNMLVHYLSPHGLEQYGGAAWGTRDVSQGPTEFFLAINRPEVVASIIEKVYENQFEDDGNWPQWFMFDRYEEQKADESHGDIIVWPMKIVVDYLEKTKNYQILKQPLSYTSRENNRKTTETATLYEHLKKEIAYIENNFLEGTYLSCYGDGDWDDTLQPYDGKLKKYMASSWTVALTYQVIKKLSVLLESFDETYSQHLMTIVNGIEHDFNQYLLQDDTLPGFVYREGQEDFEPIIHPKDTKTGIQYRLLPMNRSMIAELLTPEQVQHHLGIIKEHLTFPDGVRLMNRPAHYQGGVSVNFKRAEQASNFGREVGLQYVHAHIRYTEAMAKLGRKEEAWHALQLINPIQIKKVVPNAELRQANVYFSSSYGNFKTRYEAQENFGKLRESKVGVKGGWRVYSSGPGIYLNQLITNVLGVKELADAIIFDPVLPQELSGMSLTYKVFGKDVQIKYYEGQTDAVIVDGEPIAFDYDANRYRLGGLKISKQDLLNKLKHQSVIEIYR